MSVLVNLSPIGGAGQQFFDNSGNVLSGGKLYTYAAGTTTPLETYTSNAGTVQNANPIILDSSGRTAGVWLIAGSSYKFVLKTSADVTLGTWDNITGIPAQGVNASTTTTQSYTTGSVQATVTVADTSMLTEGEYIAFLSGSNRLSAILNSKTAASITFTPVSPRPPGEVADGTVFASGSSVAVTGAQGATGPTGATGSQGPSVAVRNSVVQAAVNATTGVPNWLSAGAGLTVSLAATTTNVYVTFAAGFSTTGPVDYVSRISADVSSAWTGLTNGTTNYLYIDYSAGTLTYASTTLAPVIQPYAPTAPSTGQHWFDTTTFTMKRYSGSAWVQFYRVFVGHAVTSGGAVTSVVNYSLGKMIVAGNVYMPGNTNLVVYKAVSQAIAAGATDKILLDTVVWDVTGEFDSTNKRINIREKGFYEVTLQYGGTNATCAAYVYVNGVSYGQFPTQVTNNEAKSATRPMSLNAGDYVELYIGYTGAPGSWGGGGGVGQIFALRRVG